MHDRGFGPQSRQWKCIIHVSEYIVFSKNEKAKDSEF